jgi:hypothetical protein
MKDEGIADEQRVYDFRLAAQAVTSCCLGFVQAECVPDRVNTFCRCVLGPKCHQSK